MRSENEKLATKLENSVANSNYENENKNLVVQVQTARQEMNELATLQASINKVTTGQKLSMERMKHFSGEQDKQKPLHSTKGGAKSIEKRNKTFEGNDIRGAEAIKRFKRHSK